MNLSQKLIISVAITLTATSVYGQQTKLMTYNIGSSNWSTTKDSVIARVITNDPDVFCAIEAGQNNRPYLESSLSDYRMLQTFGGSPQLTDSHIFLRKYMFTVVDSGYTQMDTYGGYTGIGRYVNWARLQNNSSGSEFIVYASHFVATVGATADSATIGQYRHADRMVQLMDQHTSQNNPQITVGDFNARRQKDVMKFLLNQTPVSFNSTTITNPMVLDDSWEIANPTTLKPATTSSGSSAIDWILITPNTNVINAIIDSQGVDGNGSYPSDHLPLQITFDLPVNTKIDDKENDIKVKVFTNPFHDHVQFEIELKNPERIFIQIYDIKGRLIKSRKIEEIKARKYKIRLDLSDLSAKIFLYRVISNEQLKTGLIIKNILF